MKLPILMYHKVSKNNKDYLTITTQQLEDQMRYLVSKRFNFITTKDLLLFFQNKKELPSKPLLLTFDDAHISFINFALPILNKFDPIKVTLFVASDLIGTKHPDCDEIITLNQLKNLDFNVVEPALHSHKHQSYKSLSLKEIQIDLKKNLDFFEKNQIPFSPVFAYPYGSFPKDKNEMKHLKELFLENKILLAFRIGNRINRISKNTDLFQLNRLDIKGKDSLLKFKLKINFGKIL